MNALLISLEVPHTIALFAKLVIDVSANYIKRARLLVP